MSAKISAMPTANELFALKLTSAVKRWGGPATMIAEKIGVGVQSLYQYMAGSTPKPAVLNKLAKVLVVDIDWLTDDEDERLDPVPPQNTDTIHLSDVPNTELLMEVLRRMRLQALDLHRLIVKASAAKTAFNNTALHLWLEIWKSGLSRELRADEQDRLTEAADIWDRLNALSSIYNLDRLSATYHRMLPGYPEVEDCFQLTRTGMELAYETLTRDCPGIKMLKDYRQIVSHNSGTTQFSDEQVHGMALLQLRDMIKRPEGRGLPELAAIKKDIKKHGLHKPNTP